MSEQPAEVEVLYLGKFLRILRRGRWEYVDRTKPVGAVFIGAVTPDGCLLVTEEFRVPVNAWVIGCPAGLVGDLEEAKSEELVEAANRELEEEAGYVAEKVELMTSGPTSAGLITEVIGIVLAEGLRQVGAGGGVSSEQIRVQKIPLTEIDVWLARKEADGRLIDPKVYAVLYFVRFRSQRLK